MIIKRDNREQKKLEFNHPEVKKVIDTTLNVGDYSASFGDYNFPFVFEKKSLSDLYGTLGSGYSRFKREIERSKEQKVQLIIIVEANLSKVLKGAPYSSRSPVSVVYQIFTIWARHSIPTVFCKDSEEASNYITQFFLAHYKEWQDSENLKRSISL